MQRSCTEECKGWGGGWEGLNVMVFRGMLLHMCEAFRKVGRGTERQLEPTGNAEFLEQVIAMRFDRLFADKESGGNLLVSEAGTNEIENIDFLLGQMDIVMSVRVAA